MARLTEYKDMNPRAKAVVEGIATARGNCSNALVSTTSRTRSRMSCRAECASASRSAGRSSTTLSSY